MMIIYYWVLNTVQYCPKNALYSSPATTCTKFSVHVGDWFLKKKWIGGWVGVVSSIQFYFWMSRIAFNFGRPLVFCFVLYCILYVLWMYIIIYEIWKKNMRYLSMKYWLGLNGYWPASAKLAQHLTDQLNAAPSKHVALNRCWFDAGSTSQTVGQHWVNVGFAGSVDKCFRTKTE